ncbi:T9SS C-terminal target domain-containing protein [Chryseobacterium sp. H3056]|uniref:T9SS C-terminal target domain-containing protein n=1 Tax=Kaistella daneshvariae TaxID=2487074 RepID=A0A3N0WV27_9FLAO|nr:S8 family peptidase [Kaistella daneshvariae]ROI08928.1 T9SS C-terminal target domain-containing protein [Kaistella daneshvariae]
MKKALSVFILLTFSWLAAQSEFVFVYFKDKPNKAAFYANPTSELSQKSLDRRARFSIPLNDQDAPIEAAYIKNITDLGFTVKDYSKWMNGVALHATPEQIETLKAQSYVQSVESFIKHPAPAKLTAQKVDKFALFNKTTAKTDFNYGLGLTQINQINLRPLHISGFTGKGMTIAVIDTGFPQVDTGSVYDRIRNNGQIKGGYNFIGKNNFIYSNTLNNHGSYVLGVIAAYVENQFVGSAPDADFYLYATEDADNEVPEEQLYWTEAAEEADRKGVDLITTSLGYYEFDDPRYNLLYSDMDGKTSFIARTAQIATEKGIFVVASAGNEAQKPWHYIITPADNEKVFAVGAVTAAGTSSSFSSFGPNALGRVKPDASARGTATYMGYDNSVVSSSGTSFSAPLAAGGIACLLQALPQKKVDEISELLRQNASLYPDSTPQMGYGILNFAQTLEAALSTSDLNKRGKIQIYPNPVVKTFTIKTDEIIKSVNLFDVTGRKISGFKQEKFNNIEHLAPGLYFLQVETDKNLYVEKLIKQ